MGSSTSKQEREVKESSRGRRRRRGGGENDEREGMVLAMRRMKEEVKRLRKKAEEKTKNGEWECVVEQMRLERAVRDETVERWKNLYLAIKNELDDLLFQTTYGEGLQWRPDEEGVKTMQELRQELKVKEETIEGLKERIALMEKQQHGNQREIDLLRQSLRILSSESITKKKKKKKKKAPSSSSRSLSVFKNTCVESK